MEVSPGVSLPIVPLRGGPVHQTGVATAGVGHDTSTGSDDGESGTGVNPRSTAGMVCDAQQCSDRPWRCPGERHNCFCCEDTYVVGGQAQRHFT